MCRVYRHKLTSATIFLRATIYVATGAHEPHHSSEKQFKSINTFVQSYDDIITSIRKNHIISFVRIERSIFVKKKKKIESPSSKDTLCRVWSKLKVLERKILKLGQCIFAISLLSPLEMGGALHLNKHEASSPMDAVSIKFG